MRNHWRPAMLVYGIVAASLALVYFFDVIFPFGSEVRYAIIRFLSSIR